MRNQHNDVGDELKAVAQDMLALGARAMQTGRNWLNDWRNDMNERSRGEHHHQGGQRGPDTGRSQWQQSRPHQQGQASHGSDYYASQDYGRAQAYGREGLHSEYGSYGGSARGHAGDHRDNRFGEREGGGRGSYAWQRDDRRGTGYGSSSGYGSPQEHSYASGSWDRPSFVNPADTQSSGGQAGAGGYASGQYGSAGGRYRGFGPRNYTRSDSRIHEDLCERLTEDPDVDASDIEVSVSNGTVTLEGTVEQRWMKHRAEDLADACGGVRHVENRIRVQSGSMGGGGSQGFRSGGQGEQERRASGGTETGAPSTPTSRATSSGSSSGSGSGAGSSMGSAGSSSAPGSSTGTGSGSSAGSSQPGSSGANR